MTNPQTIMEQVDAIMDAMFGPTAYSGVSKLHRMAEYCSDQCLIESTKDEAFCNGFADACKFLERHADSLDAYLVESFIGEPEPDHDDAVHCCPDCERPNQFGELCVECARERDEQPYA